jgi:hypothetical protein
VGGRLSCRRRPGGGDRLGLSRRAPVQPRTTLNYLTMKANTTELTRAKDGVGVHATASLAPSTRLSRCRGRAREGQVEPCLTRRFSIATACCRSHSRDSPFHTRASSRRPLSTGRPIRHVHASTRKLVRNQDYELNIGPRDAGGTVGFDIELWVRYRPRVARRSSPGSTSSNGRSKREVLRLHPGSLRWRVRPLPACSSSASSAASSRQSSGQPRSSCRRRTQWRRSERPSPPLVMHERRPAWP